MFSVDLFNRQYDPVPIPPQLTAEATRWGHAARGGPDDAEVRLTGDLTMLWQCLNWLRYTVWIRDHTGALRWWGYVHEVMVNTGGAGIGLTLETMHNSIKVKYSFEDADGAAEEGETGTGYGPTSILMYGTKELTHTAGDMDATAAEKLRDTLLSWQASPVAIAEGGAGEPSATLRCRGWWNTTAWQYYADASGRVVFEDHDAEQLLGWTLAGSALVGFTKDKRIHHQGTDFAPLREGDKLKVTGSGSNNATFTVEEAPRLDSDEIDNEVMSLTGTGISFEASDDIKDSSQLLGFVRTADVIEVEGTSSNNGWYRVGNVQDPGWIVVMGAEWDAPISNESAGSSFTIRRSLNVRVAESVTGEAPSASVTVTAHGQKIAQKFAPSGSGGTWTADEVSILIRKVGGPSDNVQVDIFSDNAGSPNASLASTTLSASSIGTKLNWHKFTFATPATLTVGTSYWVVVSRTGTANTSNYYFVGMDEELGYGDGDCKLYDGAAWAARVPDADMPFQVWGLRDNVTQIGDIADAKAEHVVDADLQVSAGVDTRHYRDGTGTAQDEINALLDQGNSSGARLLAKVTPGRRLQVYAEPDADPAANLYLADDGRFYYADGRPLEPGACPAGEWCYIQGLPPIASVETLSPLFLERVEYDAGAGRWFWEPRGAPSVETMPTVLTQG